MHNERLKRIAKFLGNQGLYTEANNLIKVAADPFPGETGEEVEKQEAYRESSMVSMIAEELVALEPKDKTLAFTLLSQDEKLEELVSTITNINSLLEGKKPFVALAIKMLVDNKDFSTLIFDTAVEMIKSKITMEDVKREMNKDTTLDGTSAEESFPERLYPE